VLLGAAWQRCRVHWMRTVLAQVPRGNSEMVAAAIRTIIAPPDADHMRSQLDVSLACSAASSREVEAMLDDDGDRAPHRRRRRLPNPEALRRLAGAVLVEAHD
jgi:putative transposase